MAITTTPQFFYIDRISATNRFLDFNEGIGELTASITPGGYAISELVDAVSLAMNEAGTQAYVVSFDRSTRLITISAASNFSLLAVSGTNAGFGVLPTLGFTTDRTGSNSYTSDTVVGNVYTPQFPLQNFRGFEDNEEAIDSSTNETPSGVVEVITFGMKRFMSFNIRYIKDGALCDNSPYGNDPNAVQNARDFLSFCITKARLEFMKDNTDPNTFDVILLESTPKSSQGVAYELRELYDIGIGFYETGIIRFRKIE